MTLIIGTDIYWSGPKADCESPEPQNTKMTPDMFATELLKLMATTYSLLLRNVFSTIAPLVTGAIMNQNDDDLKNLVGGLREYLEMFRQNCMYYRLVSQFFSQVFRHINRILFNEIILTPELCSFTSAVTLKFAISKIRDDMQIYGEKWIGPIDECFIQCSQLIAVLLCEKVTLKKPEVRKEICPDITLVQLKQILSVYQNPDDPVGPEIIQSLHAKESLSDPIFSVVLFMLLLFLTDLTS